MNKLKTIREKCIEANPEIVELVEWCGFGRKEDWRNCIDCVKSDHIINLADLLIAIETNRKLVEQKISIDTKGYLTLFNYKWEAIDQVDWNLKETLENQSKETIDYIHNLLCQKK